MVEIGPGRGILTAPLALLCRRLIAVELDERLCDELRERFSGERHVSIVHEDFLSFRPGSGAAYKVVGNIPYSRTAAIVRRLVDGVQPPEDAYLILQREAAERFAGTPFAPESLPSLLLKPWWHVEIVRRLRRTDFDPPPRVDSVVLWLARRTRPLLHRTDDAGYRSFIEACFGQGGNTVQRCLRSTFTRKQIDRLSRDLRFDSSASPSSLSFYQWLGLYRFRALNERG